MDRPRQLALTVLLRCSEAGQYSNLALDSALKRNELSSADRALLTVLVYGTLERRLTLEAALKAYSSRAPEELSPEVRTALLLGLYQLKYLDRIPDHAAVNETVSLVSRRAAGYVNAVLRAFLRGGKEIPLPDRASAPAAYLSVAYSVGEPLVRAYLAAFGEEKTESILAAFGNRGGLSLRVNTLHLSREDLLERFHAAGISASPTAQSPVGLRLSDLPPASLPGFDEGDFFVQDEASQLCVAALSAAPGMLVLDACACPGSKSFGAAIDMQNTGSVTACDLHRNKLSLVVSGAERLGIGILSVLEKDARSPREEWLGRFDRVLCDVPCSGLGVLAKKPELRYKDPEESVGLPEIQKGILARSSEFVAPGGRLVYSTCTLLPRENGEVVSSFLRERREFSLLRERTLFPDTDGTDGFYFAVLERTHPQTV